MKYGVTFIQYYQYEVEAENEDEAMNLAEKEFYNDTHRPIANTTMTNGKSKNLKKKSRRIGNERNKSS